MCPNILLEPVRHDDPTHESVKISADQFESILNIQQSILDFIARDYKESDILNKLCKLSETLLENSVASIMLLDDTTSEFKLVSAPSIAKENHEFIESLLSAKHQQSIADNTYFGKPIYTTDSCINLKWKDSYQSVTSFQVCSYWLMPVFDRTGKIIGLFSLSSLEHRAPTDFHDRLLRICASTVSILLERKELRKLSMTDKLTKLWNRTKLDEVLEQQDDNMDDSRHNYAVLLIDVDLFKQVNDKYGHNIGDKVLIELSDILRSQVSGDGIVGRWGGEEFMVILTKPNSYRAAHIAQRIRKKVADHHFDTVGKVTVSIGGCVVAKKTNTFEVIDDADQVLYEAKKHGRNCILVNYRDMFQSAAENDVPKQAASA